MYFTNEEHKKNFDQLTTYYWPKIFNRQYRASIYIAAVPELYKLLNPNEVKTSEDSPLSILFDYDDETGESTPVHPGLSNGTRQLLEVGMSIYNGRPCSLDFKPSIEYGQVIVESLLIRWN